MRWDSNKPDRQADGSVICRSQPNRFASNHFASSESRGRDSGRAPGYVCTTLDSHAPTAPQRMAGDQAARSGAIRLV